MKKKEFPPLTPLAKQIVTILDKHTHAPRYGIVTGKTVSAVYIADLFEAILAENELEMKDGEIKVKTY